MQPEPLIFPSPGFTKAIIRDEGKDKRPTGISVDEKVNQVLSKSLSSSYKLEQAVKLTIDLDNKLKNIAVNSKEVSEEGHIDNSKKGKHKVPLLNLTANSKKEMTKRGIICRFDFERGGIAMAPHFNEKKIYDTLTLAILNHLTEEEYKKEFDKFVDLLIQNLAFISQDREELNHIVMPEKISGNQDFLCPELRDVLEKARKVAKIQVYIPYKAGSINAHRDLLPCEIEDGKRIELRVKVVFSMGKIPNLAQCTDESIINSLAPIPSSLKLKDLWDKHEGEPVQTAWKNAIVKFHEYKESTDFSKNILRDLVRTYAVDLLQTIEPLNAFSSSRIRKEEDIEDAKVFLGKIRHACGEEIINEAKKRIVELKSLKCPILAQSLPKNTKPVENNEKKSKEKNRSQSCSLEKDKTDAVDITKLIKTKCSKESPH